MAQIISVHSFRGGTGKSNLIANLAATIARQGLRVGIIDTDIQSPGIHVLFGLNEEKMNRALNDYLWGRCNIKDTAYDVSHTLMAQGETGIINGRLYLIPSSIKAGEIARVLREGYDVVRLNDGFQELIRCLNLDYLFIDTHPGLNEETLLSIGISNVLIVILRPDSQDLQGTAVTVDVARKLKVPKMLLVINKALPAFDFVDLQKQVETTYNVSVAGILPLSEEMVLLASKGIFCLHYCEHPISQTVKEIAATVSQSDNNPLSRAFAAIEGGETSGREIARLSSGEVVGEVPFIGTRPIATTVRATEKSLVMSISQQQLAVKLQQDVGFASRFYRAIAIMLSDRLQSVINQLGRSNQVYGQPLRDVLFILGELHDSDIDWMMATGKSQNIPANTVLIHERGPVDALYILLSGTMSLSVSADSRNPLTRAFAAIEGGEISGREIARLSKGEILGETPFIDGRLPSATVKAIEDSLVLTISRQQLAAKLQQDIGFASRFYRVIATLLSNRLQGMYSPLGYGRRVYRKGQPLDENIEYEDELDSSVLDRMSLAGTRFDWMQRRLKAS